MTEHNTRREPWDTLREAWASGHTLPTDSAQRKLIPVATGAVDYIPAALVAMAAWSRVANDKHNPGEPMYHARGKSVDHDDCQLRHKIDAGDPGRDRLEELTCKFWRAGIELQEYAESLGAPLAPAAVPPTERTNKK